MIFDSSRRHFEGLGEAKLTVSLRASKEWSAYWFFNESRQEKEPYIKKRWKNLFLSLKAIELTLVKAGAFHFSLFLTTGLYANCWNCKADVTHTGNLNTTEKHHICFTPSWNTGFTRGEHIAWCALLLCCSIKLANTLPWRGKKETYNNLA